jgi:AcrR family transcriptional regulator
MRLLGILRTNPATWLEDFFKAVRGYYETFPDRIRRELMPALLAYAGLLIEELRQEMGFTGDFDHEKTVRDFTENYIERHIESSLGQLESLATGTAEEVENLLRERLEEWEAKRAAKIAMRESVRAGGTVARSFYAAVGVATLMWLAVEESCPYCQSMDGSVQSIFEPFLKAGDHVNPEGDTDPLPVYRSVFAPPVHDGCDCLLVPGL